MGYGHRPKVVRKQSLPMGTKERRRRLTRQLFGVGIELGPGHNPYPVDLPGITVRYVDRWEPEANRELFPELGEDAVFPRPDIVADLDTDRLGALGDATEDFVIASHVLEHLANPIAMLTEVHRVLRPGGVLLILLPDRHLTFDRLRSPTGLAHLVAEYEADIRVVDNAHIEEYIRATAPRDVPLSDLLSGDPVERQRQIQMHRDRSIHAHCWDQDEFLLVLRYCISDLGNRWELVEALSTKEEGAPEASSSALFCGSRLPCSPPR